MWLEAVHIADFVRKVTQGTLASNEVRRREFPWSPDLVKRILQHVGPDLWFYLAGSGPHGGNRLGKLAFTKEGLRERGRIVLEPCRDTGVPPSAIPYVLKVHSPCPQFLWSSYR